MTKRAFETVVLLVLSGILAALIFLAPSYGSRMRSALLDGNAESQALTADLVVQSSLKSEMATAPKNGVVASVYSRYPFGGRNEFTIDEGTSKGILSGNAVLFQGILIGKVVQADRDSAVVQTIFDGGFSLAVRVASSGANGLLTGGNYPLVASMAKNADVAAGDIVVSVAPGFPYGAAVGTLGTPVLSSNSLFLEAPLMTAYDLASIKAVTVIVPQ